jgi:hypothetical protein
MFGRKNEMTRKERDYSLRSQVERVGFEKDTWCDKCQEADLGLIEPREFEENDRIFIEGKCLSCGGRVVSEIIIKDVPE